MKCDDPVKNRRVFFPAGIEKVYINPIILSEPEEVHNIFDIEFWESTPSSTNLQSQKFMLLTVCLLTDSDFSPSSRKLFLRCSAQALQIFKPHAVLFCAFLTGNADYRKSAISFDEMGSANRSSNSRFSICCEATLNSSSSSGSLLSSALSNFWEAARNNSSVS